MNGWGGAGFTTVAQSRHGVYGERTKLRIFEVSTPFSSMKVHGKNLTSGHWASEGYGL